MQLCSGRRKVFYTFSFPNNRRNGAHPDIIKREVKQLQEIESRLSKEFFRDVKKRFRRKTRRATLDNTASGGMGGGGGLRRKSLSASASKHLRPTETSRSVTISDYIYIEIVKQTNRLSFSCIYLKKIVFSYPINAWFSNLCGLCYIWNLMSNRMSVNS